MISDNYIPEKINEYNVYLDGVKMIGVASSHTLPEVNMQTSTVSGMGVNGEVDSPTLGQFESMEQEIQFNTLYSSAVDMLNPPEGCPFAPRCEKAMKICLQKMPPYVEVGENHRSACWLRVQEQVNKQKEAGGHE